MHHNSQHYASVKVNTREWQMWRGQQTQSLPSTVDQCQLRLFHVAACVKPTKLIYFIQIEIQRLLRIFTLNVQDFFVFCAGQTVRLRLLRGADSC